MMGRMALDEAIEQLSFGRSLPRLESCLGLFISPEVIFLAEVRLSSGKPQVLHLVRLPVPAGAAAAKTTRAVGSLNTEFLADEQLVLGILQKAIKDIAWSAKHVVVTLSHHFGILRYFAMPAIDRRFWKTAVPAEAKKYVPLPFATLSHDFQVAELPMGADRKPRMGALFGVTQKQNLDNLRVLMEKLGLTLIGTELAPCSVERLWDAVDPAAAQAPYAQVHFDGGHVRILISDGGVPIFFREVFLSNDATVLDRRKVDLGGCIDFTRKQIGSAGPQRVRVSGRINDLPAWQQALSQDMNTQVAYLDIDQALGLKGGQWGGYAAAGAALRHLASTPLTLDLSAVGKISDEDRRAATTILAMSGAFAAVLILIGAYRFAIIQMKSRQLAQLRGDPEIQAAFAGKQSTDIEAMMDQMQQKVRSLGSLTRTRVPLTRLLESVSEEIPQGAWIHQLEYKNPIELGGRGRSEPRSLSLTGKVIDESLAVEQDVAYKFADKLRRDEEFKKAFGSNIEIAIEAQKAQAEGENPRTLDPEEAIKRRLRQATGYRIICLSAKERSS